MFSRIARWSLPAVCAVLIGACASQQSSQTPPAVDTAGITAALDSLNKAFIASVAARDTDGVVAYYASDARVMPAGAPRADGHDAIRAMWVAMLQTPGLDLKLASSQPIITESGDMVIDIGSYTMGFTGPKGKPMEDVGKYVTIFKKVDGSWKIVVDTFNSDKPATGA